MILPQVQAIRDTLDTRRGVHRRQANAAGGALTSLGRTPDLVVTDSQVFGLISNIVPPEIPLTSFSILMARCKAFWKHRARRGN